MPYPGLDLAGKVAVVIGGTSGIGRALAHGLAAAGADVVATGRRAERVAEVATEIEALGRRTLRVPVDVSGEPSLHALFRATVAAFGKVDVLVNSAGRTARAPTLDLAEADWHAILETNLTGTLRACRIFGRHMVERRFGRIINIASLASFVALYQVAAYNASKAAVAALTKSLAIEWARDGVCVNAIAPGVFPPALNASLLEGTERGRELLLRTPMQRFGRLEELAGATVFPASDAASSVTEHLPAVGGGLLSSGVNA